MNKLFYICLLSFASLSHVSMAEDVLTIGINYCRQNPTACGLEASGSYNNGKQQCISEPTSCGISGGTGIYTQAQYDAAVASATQTGIQSGRNECISNPAACGISGYTQAQYDAAVVTATQTGIQSGRNECISNPTACNIPTYTQEQLIDFTQKTKETGRKECQDNPTSCGISIGFTQAQLDQKVNDAKLQLDMSDGQFISDNGKILKATLYIPSFNTVSKVTPEMALLHKFVLNNEAGKEPYMFQLVFPTTPSQEQSGTGTQNTTSSTTQTTVK